MIFTFLDPTLTFGNKYWNAWFDGCQFAESKKEQILMEDFLIFFEFFSLDPNGSMPVMGAYINDPCGREYFELPMLP
jgi:hypothetical protein